MLGTALIPVLAMCQIASVAGYDMQVTLSILESAGNTLSIFLRSALATLPTLWLLLIASYFGYAASARIDNDPVIYSAMPWLRVSSRAASIILVVMVLAAALVPWPYLVVALLCGLLVFLMSLTINTMVNSLNKRIDKSLGTPSGHSGLTMALKRLDDKGNRFAKEGGLKRLMQALILAGITLLWLVGSPWMPYERLTPATAQPFTGKVLSNDSGELLLIAAGSTPELIRLPAENTRRELCHPVLANTIHGKPGDATSALTPWDWRTVLQLVFDVPKFDLVPCPTANRPDEQK
ncbi:hypothetical protein [Kribbella jiaozuonensis]|uniref:Uncharacterized protein n=1 Tax=Kribbella jiaozuonensis TaxID=2575441 RepID=A0A4U3LGF2_9ACTN|nr:hypothetical protein [Kribbella jiaozuonensis]TKK74638.1 hypothetical protein FDA38_38465 [Kribbella jiaozuonensis]